MSPLRQTILTGLIALTHTACTGLGGPAGSASGTFIESACELIGIKPGKVWLEKVNFKVAPNVNNDAPLSIALVITYDTHLIDHLKQFTAREFFSRQEQLQRDNPDMYEFYKWEAVPGSTIMPQEISPKKPNGEGIIIFANYQSLGSHRYVLKGDREITIMLGRERFDVKPVEPEKPNLSKRPHPFDKTDDKNELLDKKDLKQACEK